MDAAFGQAAMTHVTKWFLRSCFISCWFVFFVFAFVFFTPVATTLPMSRVQCESTPPVALDQFSILLTAEPVRQSSHVFHET